VSFKPTHNVLIAESGRRGRGAEISQVILLQDFFPGERWEMMMRKNGSEVGVAGKEAAC
jgi:hypothetical protein